MAAMYSGRRGEDPASEKAAQQEVAESKRGTSVDEVFGDGVLEKSQAEVRKLFNSTWKPDGGSSKNLVDAAEFDLWHRILTEGASLVPDGQRQYVADKLVGRIKHVDTMGLHKFENIGHAGIHRVLTGESLGRFQKKGVEKTLEYWLDWSQGQAADALKEEANHPGFIPKKWGTVGEIVARCRLVTGKLPFEGEMLQRLRAGYTEFVKQYDYGKEKAAWRNAEPFTHTSVSNMGASVTYTSYDTDSPIPPEGTLALWKVLQANEVRILEHGGIELT